MVKKVTDPALLQELNRQPVTDPRLLAELNRKDTQLQEGTKDFISGVNRAYAGIGDLGVMGMNALINWSNETQQAKPPRDGVVRPPIQPIGSTSDALRSVGVDLDRPRGFMGMLGEYSAFGPAAAERTVAGAGREALTTLAATAGGRAANLAFPDSPAAEMIGAISPFGLAPAMAGLTRWGFRGTDPAVMQERLANMDAVGVKPTVGSASGNKRAQALEGAVGVLPGGHGVIKERGVQANQAIEDEITALAGGNNISRTSAGATLQEGLWGAQGWVNHFRGVRDTLYSKLDAKIPRDTPVGAYATDQAFKALTAVDPKAPNLSAGAIDPVIQRKADQFFADQRLGNGSLTYESLASLRTELQEQLLDPELVGKPIRAKYQALVDAITEDIKIVAKAKGAEAEYNAARRYNKLGKDRIEDFFDKLSKKVTPEEVYNLAIGKAPEDATRLFKLKNSLAPDEWQYIRQTVLNRMGRAPASRQTEEVVFSAETFLTNYNNMRNNPRVLDALFGTTKSPYRQAIDTVAKNASYLRESSAVLANPSGTAGLGLQGSALYGALGGAGNMAIGAMTGATTGAVAPGVVTGLAAGYGGAYGLGKLLTNEQFVRWLAKGTELPVKQIPGHLARLTTIANNNPDMADAIEEYRKRAEAIWELQSVAAP